MVATDPRLIPLGTRLYVPGYGLATVEDTGSGVRGRMIDLGYEDHNFRSWRAYLTVYLRTPVPPADQITWILP
jgi:3D (Asp-Asp-Asp) domain-containing protein